MTKELASVIFKTLRFKILLLEAKARNFSYMYESSGMVIENKERIEETQNQN